MKLTLRFIVPIFLVVGFLVLLGQRHFGALQEQWATRDLDVRATLVSNLVQEQFLSNYVTNPVKAKSFLTRVTRDEHLKALAICSPLGSMLVKTENFPGDVHCAQFKAPAGIPATINEKNSFVSRSLTMGAVRLGSFPIIDEDGSDRGDLIVVHDMSFIASRTKDIQRYVIISFFLVALIITLMIAYIADLSWKGWLNHMRSLVRNFRGAIVDPKQFSGLTAYTPIVKDLRKLVGELEAKRIARDEALQSWTPKILKEILHEELSGEQVLIVSNREPFIHKKTDQGIVVQRPASGLVTALEPIMEACSGVWIAHGSGSADREVVDKNDKIAVPPENPSYSLRRVWLTEEEEQGYYYGFANEGLWPLCHIAHTRPLFRSDDYDYYKKVNQKFADVVIREAATDAPVILIQDYHFALMPRMIRKKLPKAVIITFWHIPWPNPEVFGICPWREELIDGLLGSSIMGFHTQFHCNNFFDTVDRFLECRIDREGSAISYMGATTGIKPYPISIEWPPKLLNKQLSVFDSRVRIREQQGMPADIKLGIGVDRLDYTKGIVERFLAVETLLKQHPEWIGRFSFVQIAAPSRSQILSYKHLHEEVVAVAERINKKFGLPAKTGANESGGEYKPIILKIEHHEPPSVYEHLRAADICYVSSLHDGMNLVAKEFIASRDDEQGVLVLSSFTGASRELPEALIVNPYNIDQAAENLYVALTMSPREQKERMKSMRSLVSEFNIYRWAGRMLLDAATIKKRNKFKKWMHRENPISQQFIF